VALSAARRNLLAGTAARAGAAIGLALVLLAAASGSLQNAAAEGDTRTLSFHHLHTGEDITVTFKRNGRYDQAALKKLDWFMRDWRKQQQTSMDPHLFDLLWEAYREVGATAPIQVVCGYRSPSTNAMLRRRSSGVAELSEHTLGHAMDFYIPGVSLEKLREIGLRLQRGGVGFYPSSGSPFVHMDTGNIRHWPRMTYAQLSKVFPDGRTVHVAADGRPLPGFALALAEVERRGKTPNMLSLEQARAHGAITDRQEETAEAMARHEKRTLLARIFGDRDSDEAADEADTAPAPTAAGRTRLASAATKPAVAEPRVPLPAARPGPPVAVASAAPEVPPLTTASLPANLFDARGLWETAPKPLAALADAAGGTGSQALAYASATGSVPAAAPKATGAGGARSTAPLTSGAQRLDSPWLRAAMLTPSVTHTLTATRSGAFTPRGLEALLHKPAQAVAMAFSADPTAGLRADRFGGTAVTFVATATFVRAQTASLD
jgi:uncharacterized protein YcbK (DUF882 family)